MPQEIEALERIKAAVLSATKKGEIVQISEEDKDLIYSANKFSIPGLEHTTTLMHQIVSLDNPYNVLYILDENKIKGALNKLEDYNTPLKKLIEKIVWYCSALPHIHYGDIKALCFLAANSSPEDLKIIRLYNDPNGFEGWNRDDIMEIIEKCAPKYEEPLSDVTHSAATAASCNSSQIAFSSGETMEYSGSELL